MRLAIDPGHGAGNLSTAYDPGAVAGGHTEAAMVLQLALTGKWVLTQSGIAVWFTRDDDSDPTPIGTRDDRAEAAGCDRFISLHMNAAGPLATGTEAYYRDDADKRWAEVVNRCAVEAFGLRNRGVKHESVTRHGRLAVMGFNGPACLLEAGFITNTRDRLAVLDRDKRIRFWQLIAEAIA